MHRVRFGSLAMMSIVLAWFAPACSAPSNPDAGDARVDADAGESSAMCTRDLDCADALFCNGEERCMPGATGADARGCVAAAITNPCGTGQTCEEAMDRCSGTCDDHDGDGHRAASCGGDDCDDGDANRFPGNAETCDANAHDEDCDPCTVAGSSGDADHDGDLAAMCCNAIAERIPTCGAMVNVDLVHARVCGTDCDDADANVHPRQAEVCNDVDDNCDGTIDEGVRMSVYVDRDADGFGDQNAPAISSCAVRDGTVANHDDCNDSNSATHPGATEVCDGVDDDCDAQVDEDPAATADCTARFSSVSNAGFACTLGACSIATCATGRADCDRVAANGCEIDSNDDPANCGACGHACGIGGVCTAGVCDRIVDVSAGASWVCAKRSSGRFVCWGENAQGQLATGNVASQPRATYIPAFDGISRLVMGGLGQGVFGPWVRGVTAGVSTSLVFDVGANDAGQLGDGTRVTRLSLTSPSGFPTGASGERLSLPERGVAVGGDFMCATQVYYFPQPSYSTYCWGTNDFGQLGISGGSTLMPTLRVPVSGDLVELAAGSEFACALTALTFVVPQPPNTVSCWGGMPVGPGGSSPMNVAVTGNPIALAAGYRFACALRDDGHVQCWGDNVEAQLGNGMESNPTSTPTEVAGLTDATEIALGESHACALRRAASPGAGGSVVCWGSNASGELGGGPSTGCSGRCAATPVAVPGLTDATHVTAGQDFACALSLSRGVLCWGTNAHGELGDPAAGAGRATPGGVVGL